MDAISSDLYSPFLRLPLQFQGTGIVKNPAPQMKVTHLPHGLGGVQTLQRAEYKRRVKIQSPKRQGYTRYVALRVNCDINQMEYGHRHDHIHEAGGKKKIAIHLPFRRQDRRIIPHSCVQPSFLSSPQVKKQKRICGVSSSIPLEISFAHYHV